MGFGWNDIKNIEQFKENFEFSSYAVLVSDFDEKCNMYEHYTDICFGIENFPTGVIRFCLIPEDVRFT